MNLIYLNENPSPREEKEKRLGQKAKVIWMTGLSGSGKTTLGVGLEKALFRQGFLVQLLDGDLVRKGINNNLTFSDVDRMENIRRVAEVSKLFVHSGIITINCFISPTNSIRSMAREIIGNEDFIEVFMNASVEDCERRDAKGLYARARRGEIPDFTGITSPFEEPENPDLILNTFDQEIPETLDKALAFILPLVQYPQK
jgi:adenylylsulfate kinase